MIKFPIRAMLFTMTFAVTATLAGGSAGACQTVTTQPEPAVQQPSAQATHTAQSARGMVASVHPLATQAGVKALQEGGNAVDAAIATALTLGVVDGFNSGIGGGCFILIRTAKGEFFAIDGREMAPAKAHANLFRDAAGTTDLPAQTGALASGVPGALAAYHQAVTEHGRSKFSDLINPAAQIAEDGFRVTPAYASKLQSVRDAMKKFPGSEAVFFRKRDGDVSPIPYQVGETLHQPDLANTYRKIATEGPAWFYNGPFATATAAWMAENGGIMTAQDLANYHTVNRTPIKTTYRGFEIVGFPPPSSGGVHVAQILNILENFNLKALYEREPASMYHVVAEAMKFAFADRAQWLGDPDYVNVPRGLIDKTYAQQIAKKIQHDAVTTSYGTPPGADSDFFERHTTHVAAADDQGNWVALTTTVNTTFGAKYIVPGLGVVMNNQMDDFVAIPNQPNAFGLVGGENNSVQAGKRPLSSMSPTIVLKDGEPVLTVGGAGGPKIITEVLWAIINSIDLEMPVGQAIAAPRLHHQWAPTDLLLESSFDDQIAAQLKDRKHSIKRSRSMGICQGISYDPATKMFTGAHDPRTSGQAAGR